MTIRLRQCVVAVAMLMPGVGFGQTTAPTVNNDYKRFHGDGIDNVLQYVPTVAVFGLKVCGVKTDTSWKKRLTVSVASFAVNAGVTYALKRTIHERRPDGTDNRSFPSGHTSIAFCGATSLMHEYYKVSPWIGVAGYAVATTVAVDRVRRNRHHWGDVVAGAAIGCLSAEAGYLIGDLILGKDKKNDDVSLAVSPMGLELKLQL
ncbi:phosphatase PAP2 family protein [Prevotella sp.]|uniref:phosphatase PAP2 family protein n=1 Tax=Prevotella sp. TaxID=59823 RepID=UPI0030771DC3